MQSWENDAVYTFAGCPLNHIHQDTKSARLYRSVYRRSFVLLGRLDLHVSSKYKA